MHTYTHVHSYLQERPFLYHGDNPFTPTSPPRTALGSRLQARPSSHRFATTNTSRQASSMQPPPRLLTPVAGHAIASTPGHTQPKPFTAGNTNGRQRGGRRRQPSSPPTATPAHLSGSHGKVRTPHLHAP